MKYIEKSENVERVYKVYCDDEKLKDLVNDIVKNASYCLDGRFRESCNVTFESNVFTSEKGLLLPNGDLKYKNIKRIYNDNYISSFDGEHYSCVTVEATQVFPPELAFIIEGLLANDKSSIYRFVNYESESELIPIDERIKDASKAVDEIDNLQFDKKFNALNNLKKLCEKKKEHKYFNTELLKQYYMQARSLIELQLISEKTYKTDEDKKLLKDYIANNYTANKK